MQARIEKFKDYKVREDEYLTENYELICKKCGGKE